MGMVEGPLTTEETATCLAAWQAGSKNGTNEHIQENTKREHHLTYSLGLRPGGSIGSKRRWPIRDRRGQKAHADFSRCLGVAETE